MCQEPLLSEATTEQLLDELLSRNTFAGFVVYSPATHKFSGQQHESFELRSNFDDESTVFVLNTVVDTVNRKHEEKG